MLQKEKDLAHLSHVHYAKPQGLQARWDLYKYSVPPIDIHKKGLDSLKLNGTEDIIDVGCCDGEVLYYLRTCNHVGRLVGLDIQQELFKDVVIRQKEKNLVQPIEFIVGTADSLSFPDQSFDVLLAYFMLYHMPDIDRTLKEWQRVLRPNGRILVATSSQDNRPKHKAMKSLVESMIGKKAPVQFSSSFNLENGEDQLKKYFTLVDTFAYFGEIRPPAPEYYINAFHSIRDMYNPPPTDEEWNRAMNAVRESFLNEIKEKGYFSDSVKRGFFVCKK